ncbi:hypothetical protein CHO01_10580 [Cellulomonas hominis]|uniref:Uncharacterized protein n=1 Tax=Cellulomonas hominis TaxID=156981 RepID=A0A511F9M9_9CELL|nr:hypothetical protein [Cellulomonas hominis]MBB5473594.1 hypothetical protein [Cellulomonas hominis]NKY06165.1 hypothetical protein [Cellulomonas hominis]NKY09301.1 hypothetical protein [Cellulomonas hominis]GEL45942.1 hypothetical protein CHO01_10580 [Cellulomonas hominis]
MPTLKHRHAITETAAVTHALEVAGRRWPGQPTSQLLTRLIETGAQAVEAEDSRTTHAHERAVSALTDLAQHYPQGYLDEVREGWPE